MMKGKCGRLTLKVMLCALAGTAGASAKLAATAVAARTLTMDLI
jgi:hypothetical protein